MKKADESTESHYRFSPGLGKNPMKVQDSQRIREIMTDITNCRGDMQLIPLEWIVEYNELVKRNTYWRYTDEE